MKRLSTLFVSFATILLLMLCSSQVAVAQFDLGKIKKAGEQLQKTVSPDDCQPLQNLKRRIQLIKDDLEKKETAMLKMHFGYGREYLTEIKSKCPGVDAASYESELNDLEKQANATRESNASEATNRESAETQMKDAAYSIDFILDLRGYSSGMFSELRAAQEFHDKCKTANYAVRKVEIEKLADTNPDFRQPNTSMNFHYDKYINELPRKLSEIVPGFLTQEINKNIEDAYAQKAKGKSSLGQASKSAQAALLLCDGLLFFDPANESIQRLRKDANAIVDETGGAIGAAIFTSDLHKKHAGKIVFSKAKLIARQENHSTIAAAFSSADFIYGMVYLKGTFAEETHGDWNVYLKIDVDGNNKVDRKFSIRKEDREATYLNIEIAPDPATAETQGAETYTKALSEISPRFHKIKVKLDGGYTTLAEGEFDLDCSGGVERFKTLSEKLRDKRLSKVRMPEPGMKNAQLEKEMIAVSDHDNDKPLRVVITGKEWTVHRNAISGAIEYRTINAALATKRISDGTCRIFFLSYQQKYNGKTYGRTEPYGVGDNEEIACENVGK